MSVPVTERCAMHCGPPRRTRQNRRSVTGEQNMRAKGGVEHRGAQGTEQLEPVRIDRIGQHSEIEDRDSERHRAEA
ncbi:hypothetical protein RhoFasGS6_02935 [Rhodococcus fascians]|nr:hypothetical protein [Rhodococcus fascians]